MFDHQMVMDSEEQMIYVLGGRILDGDWDVSKYSGLYSYNVRTSKWKLLQYVLHRLLVSLLTSIEVLVVIILRVLKFHLDSVGFFP